MKALIEQIVRLTSLEIPKLHHDRDRVTTAFGNIGGESEHSWFVPCFHALSPPAGVQQIAETEQRLGHSIPEQYKQFLRIANGAKLFVVPKPHKPDGSPHVRYRLFSCDEILEINRFLLTTFVAAYSDDPEYKGVRTLTYMAYCDAANDNYQALVIDGPHRARVFLLFYELQCRPYSDSDSDFYYTIAESLELWFALLLHSGGWEGRGLQTGGL